MAPLGHTPAFSGSRLVHSSSAVTLSVPTTAAGVFTSPVSVNFESDGTGVDGLGTTQLSSQKVTAKVTVDNYADPALHKLVVQDTSAGQLVENSQRVDVHPYEEAQGFQRLLDLPGYDVTAIGAKSGKSASHIYARLSLLQLIPTVAEAFVEERITASHANLIARLPQEHQAEAFENFARAARQHREQKEFFGR